MAALLATTALVAVAAFLPGAARAQSAGWLASPVSGDFNDAANWDLGEVPTHTAFFSTSSITSLSVSTDTLVGGWTFNPGALAYTFSTDRILRFNSAGIVINGGSASITNNGGELDFLNTSTAGSASITNTGGGRLVFFDSSTAGSASITNTNTAGDLIFIGTSTAGSASITNDGGLSFNSSSSTAGSASIANNGDLIFNNNSTAGSASIINTGSLNFNNSSTAGSASITNTGSLFFNSSTAGNASITNTGDLYFINSSTAGSASITTNSGGRSFIELSASGGTARFILNGTGFLDISFLSSTGTTAGSIDGAGNVFLGSKNLAVGGNNLSTTFSGVIQDGGFAGPGTGSLTKTGIGTLTLSGINTYTGGTAVEAGTLQAGVAGAFVGNTAYAVNGGTLDLNGFNLTMSSLSGTGGTVALGAAALVINQATNTSYAGALTGTGSLTKTGSGTLTLSGANTYTGATTVDAGTLVVSGSIASSSITNNSGLAFLGTSTAGSASITNTGSLNFNNTSTAGSARITNDLFLRFVDTSTAGSATITNSGGTTFIQSASGGTARFILNGSGRLDISGLTTGGTTAGSIEDSGNVFLGSKNLAVGGNNLSTTFSGVIQDGGSFVGTGGSLTKTGTGTLTLSGVNTYTGATTVDAGTLVVNGSTAPTSPLTVNTGGTLGGNGIVGDTTINGGTLAPGHSIGLLTVQGSLTFTAASSYMVEVSPANADRTNVTGTATLGGATVNASFAAGTYVARQYTILHADDGVTGTFGTEVNTDLPTNFHTALSYDDNNAYLNLILNFAVPSGLTGNQQSVGNALTNFFNSTGGIPLAFGALSPPGLTQVSGEVATGSQQTTFDAMNQFMGLLTDPFIAGRGDPVSASSGAPQFAEENDSASAYADNGKPRTRSERDAYAAIYRKAPPMTASFAQRWSVWAAGYGGSQTTDGNAGVGSNTATSRIFGTAVGADYRFSPFTLAGFALAGGGTNFSVANGLGSGRSDLFQAGAFLRHTVGPAYISAALAYGWQDITTDRTITIAGVDQLRAKFNANAFSGRLEGGYRFVTQGVGLTPYAAGQFTTFQLPNYAETVVSGANTFALAYAAKEVTASRSELGLRSDKSFAMADGIFTLRGRAAWAHNFNTDRSVLPTFQALPGASFVVNGAGQAPDAALVTGSAEMKWLNGFSVAATFEGEFSDVTESYAGKGVVHYAW